MCSWFPPNVRGTLALTSTKNGTSPMNDAVYSACGPSEKYPWRSGGETALSTSRGDSVWRIRRGTSEKELGTRSQSPR